MDRLLEDDDYMSGSDLEDDPDNIEVPGCGMSFLTESATNSNDSNTINSTQNYNGNQDLPVVSCTDFKNCDIIMPANQSATNINLTQTQLASGPTKIPPINAKNISVKINGKVLKLNTEKAVVVTPSLLQSLGGLPVTNSTASVMKTVKIVNNNSSIVNHNIPSTSGLPQTRIGGQKIIMPPTKQGIPIHASGKIQKVNMKNTVRIDQTSLQSVGLANTGAQFKRVVRVVNNGLASTSGRGRIVNNAAMMSNGNTPTQPNGVRYQIAPGNKLIRIVNPVNPGIPQARLVGNLPHSNGPRPLLNGTVSLRNDTIPVARSSTNSGGVRFQIGQNNKLVRIVNPVRSGFPQMKVAGNGKILSSSTAKFAQVNKGQIITNGSNTTSPDTQRIISEIVNSINVNGNIQNFDSSGIARFVEKHLEPNGGKRKLVKHDHDYNGSLNQKRNRVLEEEVENEEELGVAETYASYMPSKLKLGHKHPDPVVETASLSSVAPVDVWYKLSIPMDIINSGALSALQLESITYASQAHEQNLPSGHRAGFLIGDGAGVGKGRTIAGIILENFLKGRERAIWVSISNDLKYDAERDLADIGAHFIPVHQLNKMKYSVKISSEVNGHIKKGVLFCTYSSLIGESNLQQGKYINRRDQILQWCKEKFDGLLVFDECHKAKNLCPSGSMKSTKTGKMVLDLQTHLPNARVLYASATGASEPKNMAYMVRLGLWGPGTTFKEFEDFTAAVEERGVGGMEIVAMDMKLRGMYIARQLSFQGVKFNIKEVPLSDDFIKIYNASVKLWVDAFHKFTEAAKLVAANNNMKKSMWGQFWSSHQRFFKYLCIAAKVDEAVNLAHHAMKYENRCVVIGLQSTGEARTLDQLEKNDGELTDFISTAKGVFQSLVEKHFPSSNRDNVNKILSNLSAAKLSLPKNGFVKQIDERTLLKKKQMELLHSSDNESESGDSIKLASDNEDEDSEEERRRLRKQREKEERVANANNMVNMIFGTKPKKTIVPKEKEKKKEEKKKEKEEEAKPALPSTFDIENANDMKEQLLKRIHSLGKKLPKNTLDELIDHLGGPEEVAEMTGRKGRVVQTENGIQYESRSEQDIPLETLNVAEKQRFMDGEKYVAIISEAASSGISLQSDRRAKNQKKRLHITLELPWSADKAVQQFGRTHRSNQVSAPEYVFLITNLAGERRFASIVAKRLESLGALTHGDRRASENRDLSQFNIDNKYGKAALESVMRAAVRRENPIIPPPKDYNGNFFKDVAEAMIGVGLVERKGDILTLDKEYNQIPKFLNRILGLPVELQNRLFKYFTDTMNAIISMAKRNGTFDLGILDLGVSDDEFIKRVQTTTFLYRHATGIAPIELHKLKIERGMSWKDAMQTYRDDVGDEFEGFYESHHSSFGKRYVILVTKVETKRSMYSFEKEETKFTIYRPNTGKQRKRVTLSEIEVKYRKAEPVDVKNMWIEQYNSTVCTHVYSTGKCRFGAECVVGLRIRIYHVLAGSVLPIWQKIEAAITEPFAIKNVHKNKMQVLRLKTTDNRKIVGTLIKNNLVEGLVTVLREESESVQEENFPEDSN